MVMIRIDNAQSQLMFKLGELQKIRDEVRFGSTDRELQLVLTILDRLYVFNS